MPRNVPARHRAGRGLAAGGTCQHGVGRPPSRGPGLPWTSTGPAGGGEHVLPSDGEVAVTEAGSDPAVRPAASCSWTGRRRDVPETLARAGYTVLVKGGPPAGQLLPSTRVRDGEVVARRTGKAPGRPSTWCTPTGPVEELPGIVGHGPAPGGRWPYGSSPGWPATGRRPPDGCWMDQAGVAGRARAVVESAGLGVCRSPPTIADEARSRAKPRLALPATLPRCGRAFTHDRRP